MPAFNLRTEDGKKEFSEYRDSFFEQRNWYSWQVKIRPLQAAFYDNELALTEQEEKENAEWNTVRT